MYPGEEELDSPPCSGFASHPAAGGQPTALEEAKLSPAKPGDDKIMIQTEITVSIADKDEIRHETVRPWEIVVAKPGRAI